MRPLYPVAVLATFGAGCSACGHDVLRCTSDDGCREGRVCEAGQCVTASSEPNDVDASQAIPECHNGYSSMADSDGDAFMIDLYLYPDGDAELSYVEGFLGHGFNPHQDEGANEASVEAAWAVEGDELTMTDVLRCIDARVVDDAPERSTWVCELTRPLGDERALGRPIVMFSRCSDWD